MLDDPLLAWTCSIDAGNIMLICTYKETEALLVLGILPLLCCPLALPHELLTCSSVPAPLTMPPQHQQVPRIPFRHGHW